MFSQVCVTHSVHRGWGSAYWHGGVCPPGKADPQEGRHPSQEGRSPRKADPPPGGQTPPPPPTGGREPGNIFNVRAVCILLECILVVSMAVIIVNQLKVYLQQSIQSHIHIPTMIYSKFTKGRERWGWLMNGWEIST